MKKLIAPLFLLVIVLASCKKDAVTNNNSNNSNTSGTPGTSANTWTFTQGSTVHSGYFNSSVLLGCTLNTYLQSNNTYTFSLLGQETSNGHFLNIVLSLDDTTFTRKNYSSGAAISDHLDAFFYFATFGTNIYVSSDNYLYVGPVMNYTISSYNPSTGVVVMTFSGQVKDVNGNSQNITNGKLTVDVEKL
jgi:hypothetical protein